MAPTHQVRFFVQTGEEDVPRLLPKEINTKSRFKMQLRHHQPAQESSETHFHIYLAQKKSALFTAPWTPYFLTDDHSPQKTPHQEWKGWII